MGYSSPICAFRRASSVAPLRPACALLAAGLVACSAELAGTGPLVEVDDAAVTVPIGAVDAMTPRAHDAAPGDDDAEGQAEDDAGRGADEREAGATGGGAPTSTVDGAAPGSPCALEGRYALRVVFEVTWAETELASSVPIVAGGRGELSMLALLELGPAASGLSVSFRECASSVPEFVSTLAGERYQMRFADETWDAPSMPAFASTASAACVDPGCTLAVQPINALIGAALASPMAAWPSESILGQWPDHDGDGRAGITAHMLGPLEGPYAYPLLELRGNRRMRDLGLGMRVVLGLGGTLENCDAFRGKTEASSVETRAVACRATTLPPACDQSELRFLNNNLPVWKVGEGQFQAKRVAAAADCAEVRGVFAGVPP